ncbi:MAG: two-component system chemotaxis response regulator CheY [Candidatus Latescibacterota bacterium]
MGWHRACGKEFAVVEVIIHRTLFVEVCSVKILVADDSPTMRRIVVQMLKRLGYTDISEADHGKDALDRLREAGDFELLLTDWNMPVMNGLELVQTIRADATLSALPILMVTTRNQKQDIVTAMREGVNNYATKPFDPKTIKEKIDKVMAAVG